MVSALLLCTALSSPGDYDYRWTKTNTELQLVLTAFTLMDVLETRWFTTHTTRDELNPLMGPHPGAARLYLMNALELAVHTGLMFALPHPYREALQGASIAVEAANVGLVMLVVGVHMQF
jgi:hypothetical protein